MTDTELEFLIISRVLHKPSPSTMLDKYRFVGWPWCSLDTLLRSDVDTGIPWKAMYSNIAFGKEAVKGTFIFPNVAVIYGFFAVFYRDMTPCTLASYILKRCAGFAGG